LKKILITGCAGFIGSHLAEYFIKEGSQVVGIDNLSRRGNDVNLNLLMDYGTERFKFCKVDIRQFNRVSDVYRENGPFDLVIHQAAQVAVTTSIKNPKADLEINVIGTFNLLEATRKYSPDAFFQYASTNKVYGELSEIRVVERKGRYDYEDLPGGVDEGFNLDFHSPYGCSKGAADQYVRDYNRIYGLRTVVLRQSCIYGTRQFGIEDQGWVAWFVIAAMLEKPLTIYGDGKQGRDLLWIDDLVEAYAALFENSEKIVGQILNVGGGSKHVLSLLGLVELLRDRGLLKLNPEFQDWRHGDQKIFISNNNKIFTKMGWSPKVAPAEGVERLIRWAENNKSAIVQALS
jgi:CDP-paratose 2-epimerase